MKTKITGIIIDATLEIAAFAIGNYIDQQRLQTQFDALYWADADRVSFMNSKIPFFCYITWSGNDVHGSKNLSRLVKIYNKVKRISKKAKKPMPDYIGLDMYTPSYFESLKSKLLEE